MAFRLDDLTELAQLIHMKITELSPRNGYRLYLRYEDNARGEVDLSSYVGKGVFSAWSAPGAFEQVQLSELGHPRWPGEIDLCPDALYLSLTNKRPEDIFPVLGKLPTHA